LLPDETESTASSDLRLGQAALVLLRQWIAVRSAMLHLIHSGLILTPQENRSRVKLVFFEIKEHPMLVPLNISFQNSEPSEAVRSEVERQAKRLEKFHDRITSCKVAIIVPQTRHRKGDLFKIDIRIAMPSHQDIIVTRTHDDVPEHEHILVAIKDAFSAAQRQIEDSIRKMRGDTKVHEEEDHGHVAKFLAGEDDGFIETADGREVYFHRNSVLDGAFDRLKVGAEVRFVEEMGEKGPQATTVRLIGKHHLQ
jgi:cold shock CspA family protein